MGGHTEQDAKAIRDELQRILTSPIFVHSERLRRFLTHCVEAALAGRIEELKEYAIGVAAFDRPRNYNPAEDPIVRVEARRLRKKLDEFYQTAGAGKLVVIGLPKGGYLPAFEVRRPPAPPPPRRWIGAAIPAAALILVALGVWLLVGRPVKTPELVLTRMTSNHGLTTDPALSADGLLLVYASDREGSAGMDIWIQSGKTQAGEAPRRLTDDPADDSQPAISPDASTVVFRSERQPPGIYAVASSGGAARLVVADGRNPRFSPDGKWLAYWVGSPGGDSLPPAGRVYVMPAAGGTPSRLAGNFTSAACPIWSPQGGRLLVEAIQAPSDALELWSVSPAGEQAVSSGAAHALDRARLKWMLRECAISWGREGIVFSATEGDTQSLWRLPVSANGTVAGAPARLTFGSAEEVLPFVAASGEIAFAGRSETMDVWRLPADRPEELSRVTEGSGMVAFPQARGSRIVFQSTADGRTSIWLKDLSGGPAEQITRPPASPRYPQLCPDGETVIYSEGPNSYAVSARSATPRLVCNGCSRVWQCGARSLFFVPAGSKSPLRIEEYILPGGPKTALLASQKNDLANAQLSADGWVAFHAITGIAQRQIFAAPYRQAQEIPPDHWVPITDGSQLDRSAVWNDRGDTLYFLSERCGFRCIWSQRVDPASKRPVGDAVAVRHFHSARRSLSAIGDVGAIGLSLAGGFLYFTLADDSGDVWLARQAK